MEKRLLKIDEGSGEEVFLKEIRKYNKEKNRKLVYHKAHKKELDKKDDKEFIKFLKAAGIIVVFILLTLIVRFFFN